MFFSKIHSCIKNRLTKIETPPRMTIMEIIRGNKTKSIRKDGIPSKSNINPVVLDQWRVLASIRFLRGALTQFADFRAKRASAAIAIDSIISMVIYLTL